MFSTSKNIGISFNPSTPAMPYLVEDTCPPAVSPGEINTSPGFRNALYTHRFAIAPDIGLESTYFVLKCSPIILLHISSIIREYFVP